MAARCRQRHDLRHRHPRLCAGSATAAAPDPATATTPAAATAAAAAAAAAGGAAAAAMALTAATGGGRTASRAPRRGALGSCGTWVTLGLTRRGLRGPQVWTTQV